MARSESEKIKLFDFYRNWTMMLILVSAKLDLNICIRVCGLQLGLPLNPFLSRIQFCKQQFGSGSDINLDILVLH